MVPRITSTAFCIASDVGGVCALSDVGQQRSRRFQERKVGVFTCSLNNYWTSHLGGPGEPSGPTRRPQGRPWRTPKCPDGHGRLPSDPTIPGLLHESYAHSRYIWLKKIGRPRRPALGRCPNGNAAPAAMPLPTEAREGSSGLVGDAFARQLDGVVDNRRPPCCLR